MDTSRGGFPVGGGGGLKQEAASHQGGLISGAQMYSPQQNMVNLQHEEALQLLADHFKLYCFTTTGKSLQTVLQTRLANHFKLY